MSISQNSDVGRQNSDVIWDLIFPKNKQITIAKREYQIQSSNSVFELISLRELWWCHPIHHIVNNNGGIEAFSVPQRDPQICFSLITYKPIIIGSYFLAYRLIVICRPRWLWLHWVMLHIWLRMWHHKGSRVLAFDPKVLNAYNIGSRWNENLKTGSYTNFCMGLPVLLLRLGNSDIFVTIDLILGTKVHTAKWSHHMLINR